MKRHLLVRAREPNGVRRQQLRTGGSQSASGQEHPPLVTALHWAWRGVNRHAVNDVMMSTALIHAKSTDMGGYRS